MIHGKDRLQYAPISALLRMAIYNGVADQHIITMVREAKLLARKQIHINEIDSSVYTYTVTIERRRPEIVSTMDADNLRKEDYQRLLDFFDSL